MKTFSKLFLATSCLFSTYTLPSQALQFMMEPSASAQEKGSISEKLIKQIMPNEEANPIPMFSEKFSATIKFLTKDKKAIEVSFYYDPHEENNAFMPKIADIEEEHGSVTEHFYKEFVLSHFPGYPFDDPEEKKLVDFKIDFLNKSENKKWQESLLEKEDFNPYTMYKTLEEAKKLKTEYKQKLEKLIHSESFDEFSFNYATPANPGFLKKYHGSEMGPILFNLNAKIEPPKKKQRQENSNKDNYISNFNYGVFRLTLSKKDDKSGIRVPNNVDQFPDTIETFIHNVLEEREIYAVSSYGNQKSSSNMYM